jgi:hypothetical protein
VKTQSYKGTLVDASCAAPTATPSPAPATANQSSSAPAAAGCAVSAGTKEFALRTDDGRTIRFDMVGNERTQQALKDKKKWSDAVAGGKTLRVKASGLLSGDTLTVVSID